MLPLLLATVQQQKLTEYEYAVFAASTTETRLPSGQTSLEHGWETMTASVASFMAMGNHRERFLHLTQSLLPPYVQVPDIVQHHRYVDPECRSHRYHDLILHAFDPQLQTALGSLSTHGPNVFAQHVSIRGGCPRSPESAKDACALERAGRQSKRTWRRRWTLADMSSQRPQTRTVQRPKRSSIGERAETQTKENKHLVHGDRIQRCHVNGHQRWKSKQRQLMHAGCGDTDEGRPREGAQTKDSVCSLESYPKSWTFEWGSRLVMSFGVDLFLPPEVHGVACAPKNTSCHRGSPWGEKGEGGL